MSSLPQAHSYLMECALQGSRLCQLSLANKHEFGLDGVPWDPELAYGAFHTFDALALEFPHMSLSQIARLRL